MRPVGAITEYLGVLDDAAFGAATEVVPKFLSAADPAARWTRADGGLAYFAYSRKSLIVGWRQLFRFRSRFSNLFRRGIAVSFPETSFPRIDRRPATVYREGDRRGSRC